jgi:chromosome segregation ATPase
MTANPTADKCFVCNQPIAENDYYERDNLGLRHVSPSKCAAALTAALAQAEEYDALCKRADAALNALTARLAAAEARAEAAEARIAVLCEEIDMKESVLSEVRTRIEAAEKALEPFAKAGAYLSSGNERDIPDAAPSSATFAVGDLRRAARALSAAGGQ